MRIVKASKRANAGDLYDEIVASVPALAPTPTGPDGKLEAKFIIEQVDDAELLVHLPDDVDETDRLAVVLAVKGHKRKPERVVDRMGDARKVVRKKADQGDELAQAILTLLGDAP